MWFIFAAKHQEDPVVAVILLVIVGVVILFALVRESTATYDLNTRNGLPICPKCKRQVSWKREHCRACGYVFKTYGSLSYSGSGFGREPSIAYSEAEAEEERRYWEKIRENARIQDEARAKAREVARRSRIEAKEKFYRDRDIEPGPLAWFKVLPDWFQPIALGVVFAGPVVVVLVLLLSRMISR